MRVSSIPACQASEHTYPVILLEHHLVPLVLAAHAEELHLHLLLAALVNLLILHLGLHRLLPLKLLLLSALVLLLKPELLGVLALEPLGFVLLTALSSFPLSNKRVLLALVLEQHPLLLLDLGCRRFREGGLRRRRLGYRRGGRPRSVRQLGCARAVVEQIGRFLGGSRGLV